MGAQVGRCPISALEQFECSYRPALRVVRDLQGDKSPTRYSFRGTGVLLPLHGSLLAHLTGSNEDYKAI